MKSQSRYTLLDAVANIQRLDLSFWKALVTNGYAGVEVVTAPAASPLPGRLNPEDLRYVIPFLRSHYDWTVIDFGRGLAPLTLAVLPEVDETFLVTTPEIPALHQAKQIVQALPHLGGGREQFHVILNRTPKRAEVSPEELEKMLGAPIYASLPSDYPALYEAYAERALVPASSNLGKHFSRLAAKMGGVEVKDKRRFGFF
jgi:Flp pilus assembly CpaE family ATPase